MRLIYVEPLRQAADAEDSAATAGARKTSPAGPAAARSAAEQSFALRAFTKFLNALLQFVFISRAEILRSSLCAVDAHGFRRSFGARSVHFRLDRVGQDAEAGDVGGGGPARSGGCAFLNRRLKSRPASFFNDIDPPRAP